MINSMTGYGQAEGELNGVTYAAEIKTVNNRYLKVNLKQPEAIAFLAGDLEKIIRDRLSRGTVNCVISLRHCSADVLFDIDEAAMRACIEKLTHVADSTDKACQIEIGSLLTLPGMLKPLLADEDQAEAIKEKVLAVLNQAIDNLTQMRAVEGAALCDDLKQHCQQIQKGLELIRKRSGVVPLEYAEKLKKRVDALLAAAELKLDEETLAREVAIFAERSDISEELTRLDSHIEQFEKSCQVDGAVGRKLDFISQEMLREANTIASKAMDCDIIEAVVDIKCCVDRIKEQVQNIE